MIRILAVGKLKAAWYQQGVEDYRRRITRFARIEIVEVPDKNPEEEGRRLLEAAAGSPLIACDPGGESLNSRDFARLIGDHGSLCFFLGGPEGLSRELVQRCDRRLSLAPFTLPHELARLVLLEQIYRGWTILKGHPYHR